MENFHHIWMSTIYECLAYSVVYFSYLISTITLCERKSYLAYSNKSFMKLCCFIQISFQEMNNFWSVWKAHCSIALFENAPFQFFRLLRGADNPQILNRFISTSRVWNEMLFVNSCCLVLVKYRSGHNPQWKWSQVFASKDRQMRYLFHQAVMACLFIQGISRIFTNTAWRHMGF